MIGIGSLHVQHSSGRQLRRDVNMIVPIDLLPPIMEDMLTYGRPNRPPRPWLGLYAAEVDDDAVVVAGMSERGPAIKSGLKPGDRIVAVRDEPVSSPRLVLAAGLGERAGRQRGRAPGRPRQRPPHRAHRGGRPHPDDEGAEAALSAAIWRRRRFWANRSSS